MAWSSGPFLASAGADQKVILWAMPDAKILHTLTPGAVMFGLKMLPNGEGPRLENDAIRLFMSCAPTA